MNAQAMLQEYLDSLFANAPRSRAAYELQEELMANALERYHDLTAKGMPEEDALRTVMDSIGNVEELLSALPGDFSALNYEWREEQQERKAIVVTVSIGLYILAGCFLLAGMILGSYLSGIFFFAGLLFSILLCIVPTCMLVYNAQRWPKYKKQNNTVVEDFKAYSNSSGKRRNLRGAVSSVIWSGTLLLYFLLSFTFGAWHITWLLFIVATCLEALSSLIFSIKDVS